MSISIHLDGDNNSFAPGGTITGEVHWKDLPVDHDGAITLELAFHTEGKGTSQREVFEELGWPITAPYGNYPFSIQAPNWPWSFSGKLVSVLWAFDAWLDDEHAASLPVTVSPNGEELDLYHYGIDEMEKGKWEKMFQHSGS